MNIFQNIMETLRQLVGSKGWDYCVLWILSEDQRCIEWVDCCCIGTLEPQSCEDELQFPVYPVPSCRDTMFQHPRSNSCELLGLLPSSLPLDSGIHAKTLISNQPRWLNHSNSLDSSIVDVCDFSTLSEVMGTRVLIPLPGGLVEFFVAKQVVEDQNLIDYVTSECGVLLMNREGILNTTNNMETLNFTATNMETMNDHQPTNPFSVNENNGQVENQIITALENMNIPHDLNMDRINICNSPLNFLHQFTFNEENRTKSSDHVYFDGAENCVQDMEALQKNMIANTENIPPMPFMANEGNDHVNDTMKLESARSDSISDCNHHMDDEVDFDRKYRRRTKNGPQSKNLMAERRRRKKLTDRLHELRALVPNISKLNKASILEDAIKYVKELQKQAKELQVELEGQSNDEGNRNGKENNSNTLPEILNEDGIISAANAYPIGGSGSGSVDSEITQDKAPQMEVQVEVAQLDGNEFFLKVFCEYQPGAFARLMEALDALGLKVTNANVTRFRNLVSNVFKVEKKDSEMVQAEYVRDSLLELTRDQPTRGYNPEIHKANEDCNGMEYHHHHHHQHLHHGHMINSNHHLHHLHS